MSQDIRSTKHSISKVPKWTNSTLVAQDSAGFVLLDRQRVTIQASTSCDSSKLAHFELVLQNQATPGREIILSSALGGNDTAEFGFLAVGSSIMLPPGDYHWIARVLVESGGFIKLNRDVNGTHQIATYDLKDHISPVTCCGNSDVFCTVQTDNPVYGFQAGLHVFTSAKAGESFSAFLSYRDINSQGMRTPETLCIWPKKSVRIPGKFMFLDNSSTYTFEAEIITTGSFQSSYTIRVG
ncbi:hypothetical protein [Undibacterium danionis]|uniref:Uncharacterized protein n=1 Tax=Undibacterium danionis TaxID=1812100 RepID=A0ABV6IIW8_9BURK